MADQGGGSLIGTIIQVIIGVVLIVTGNEVGGAIIIAGAFFQAAAVMMTPDEKTSDGKRRSVYSFGSFTNPRKGGTLAVVYSSGGFTCAPGWLQAFITPAGFRQENDFTREASVNGQSLSGLMAICEGPIVGVADVRLNGEPVAQRFLNQPTLEAANGTKKVFTWNKKRSRVETAAVSVNGTLIGYRPQQVAYRIAVGDGLSTVFRMTLPNHVLPEYEVRLYTVDPTGRTDKALFELGTDFNTDLVPRTWVDSNDVLYCYTQTTLPLFAQIWVEFMTNIAPGLVLKITDDGRLQATFKVAPPNNAVIVADFDVVTMPGIKYGLRLGTPNQLNIQGFDQTKNSRGVGEEMARGPGGTVHDTINEVDDVIFNLASDPSGFTQYDASGGHGGVSVKFTIEIQLKVPITGNIFSTYQKIPDPQGAWPTYNPAKTAIEFLVGGDVEALKTWAFSVRGCLIELLTDDPTNVTYTRLLRDFKRARYTWRLTRTNIIQADANGRWLDRLFVSDFVEVQDLWLNYPNTALFWFHALATSKLNGNAPVVTMKVFGRASVERWTGFQWVSAPGNQGNAIWAAIDYLTNRRFGHGRFYNKTDNIDITSAVDVADWLDLQVSKGQNQSGQEVKMRLDCTLDTQKPAMEQLRDFLAAKRVWASLRGNKWFFYKDEAVNLLGVPLIQDYGDPINPTARRTFVLERESTAARPTEVRITYRDEAYDHEEKEVQASVEVLAAEPRQTFRFQAIGITRQSEAKRLAVFLFVQLRKGGRKLVVGLHPLAWDYSPADVVRVTSRRPGADGFFRIFKYDGSSSNWYLLTELTEYVPDAYSIAPAGVMTTESNPAGTAAPALAPSVYGSNVVVLGNRIG